MSNPHADRRHAVRGPSGRWERRQAPDPGQLSAELPDDAPAKPELNPSARDARDARADGPAPFRLNITAEDVTPAAPGASPAPPPPGALDIDPAIDVPAARMLAAAVNTLVDMAGLPAATAAEVDKVGDYAAPVMRRAATRMGLGDAVGSTVPEWAVEVGNLAIAVGVAWGPAGAIVVRTAIERRRASAQEDYTDAESGPPGRGDGRARPAGGDDAAAARRAASWGAGADEGGPAGGPGPRQPGPLDAGGLAAIFATPGVGGSREG